jgi:hypothetical protein
VSTAQPPCRAANGVALVAAVSTRVQLVRKLCPRTNVGWLYMAACGVDLSVFLTQHVARTARRLARWRTAVCLNRGAHGAGMSASRTHHIAPPAVISAWRCPVRRQRRIALGVEPAVCHLVLGALSVRP